MALQIREITPGFGAEVTGLDLGQPLPPEIEADLVSAIAAYGVLVFPGSGLTDQTHVWFSRVFGNLWTTPASSAMKPRFGYPHLFDAGNLTREGGISDDELARHRRAGDRLWHTDSSFTRDRTTYSLLLAHEVPGAGGQTFFADMRAAYEALPEATKQRIDALRALHSWWYSRRRAGYPVSEEEIEERQPQAAHPLVHIHPGSGRKSLYLASHARDSGWDRAGQALLPRDWNSPPRRGSLSAPLPPGDLVMWDNFIPCTAAANTMRQ